MSMIAAPVSPDVSKLFKNISVPGKRDPSNHITMLHLGGELDIKVAIKILPLVLAITEKQQPFTVSCSEIICFPGGDDGFPIVGKLESKELVSLQKKIKKEFEGAKIKFSDKYPIYKPHVTLSYSPDKIDDFKISKTEWQVNEIALFCGSHEGGEKLYVQFPFSIKKMKKSAQCVDDIVCIWANKIILKTIR